MSQWFDLASDTGVKKTKHTICHNELNTNIVCLYTCGK